MSLTNILPQPVATVKHVELTNKELNKLKQDLLTVFRQELEAARSEILETLRKELAQH